MEMKGKHDSVNEWRTLLLTGDLLCPSHYVNEAT